MQEKLKVEIQTNKQYTYQLAISIHQNLNMYVEKKMFKSWLDLKHELIKKLEFDKFEINVR